MTLGPVILQDPRGNNKSRGFKLETSPYCSCLIASNEIHNTYNVVKSPFEASCAVRTETSRELLTYYSEPREASNCTEVGLDNHALFSAIWL